MMLNCRDATGLLSARLERRLTPGERVALRFHLVLCPACRRFGEQVGFMRQAMGRLASRQDTPGSSPDRGPHS